MPSFVHELRYAPRLVCGVDEAGRGPWAGPVVAAAVLFPDLSITPPPTLDDSKRVSRAERERLFAWIPHHATTGIGIATVEEIDATNILAATMLAMRRAVEALPVSPALALVDGNRPPALPCAVETLIGGDGISLSIASASILAKVTRDRMMDDLDRLYPAYGFARHAGYGTAQHRAALAAHGPCPVHRRSFSPIRALLDAA